MNKSLQEIFDETVQHLHWQGHPCVNVDGECVYRGGGAEKCAVGYWIPDSHYYAAMEGKSVQSFPDNALPGVCYLQARELLSELQMAHDNFWWGPGKDQRLLGKLSQIAFRFDLDSSVLKLWENV